MKYWLRWREIIHDSNSMNKIINRKVGLLACVTLVMAMLTACSPDNMEAPNCHIVGRMTYQGHPIGVKGSGQSPLTGSTRLELWQAGFGKEAAQTVNVAQDGTFSTYVYPGKVRLITIPGVGPWQNADTLRISVDGDIHVDYEVTPYAIITDDVYSFDAETKQLTATCHVSVVDPEAQIRAIGLLVNDRQFVDLGNQKTSITTNSKDEEVTLTINLEELASHPALYARLYVKTDKGNDPAYTTKPYHIW